GVSGFRAGRNGPGPGEPARRQGVRRTGPRGADPVRPTGETLREEEAIHRRGRGGRREKTKQMPLRNPGSQEKKCQDFTLLFFLASWVPQRSSPGFLLCVLRALCGEICETENV